MEDTREKGFLVLQVLELGEWNEVIIGCRGSLFSIDYLLFYFRIADDGNSPRCFLYVREKYERLLKPQDNAAIETESPFSISRFASRQRLRLIYSIIDILVAVLNCRDRWYLLSPVWPERSSSLIVSLR